jgi:hypothetical protein
LKFAREAADVVPVIKIPDSLGWPDPLPKAAIALGVQVLLFRLIFGLLILGSLKLVYDVWRKGKGTGHETRLPHGSGTKAFDAVNLGEQNEAASRGPRSSEAQVANPDDQPN